VEAGTERLTGRSAMHPLGEGETVPGDVSIAPPTAPSPN
jgi:hypothetical protein